MREMGSSRSGQGPLTIATDSAYGGILQAVTGSRGSLTHGGEESVGW